MAEPLKLLREFALEGKSIREKEDLIIFGDLAFEKNVKTNFKVYGKAGEYYDLESLYFFFQRSSLAHPAYVKEAAGKQIQPITRPDRKDLSQYLSNPDAKPPASIDVTAPVPVPVHLARAHGAREDRGGQDQPDDPDAVAKDRERLERILDSSLRPAAPADIRPLSKDLTADKIKELKTKALTRKRGQIQTIAEEEAAGAENFAKSIFPILQSLKNREEGRHKPDIKQEPSTAQSAGQKRSAQEGYNRYAQDKYRKEETAGFQIDTVGTFHGMTLKSVTEGAAKPKPGARPSAAAAAPAAAPPKKRISRTPIIIIPATNNSLITMYNAKDILQDLKFVSTEDKRAAGVQRGNEVLIARQKSGVSVPYRVVDNPTKLTPDEWERVVAVFVQGPAWQFKGWPYNGNPVEIFTKMCAFHLKWEETKAEGNVGKWNVELFNLSRSKRHLDRANLLRLWDLLDKFMAKHKNNLRF